jgi:hypothetical protein
MIQTENLVKRLPDQADQIFATSDPIVERVRKLGGRTEVWIDEAEKRTWFLFEAGRHG